MLLQEVADRPIESWAWRRVSDGSEVRPHCPSVTGGEDDVGGLDDRGDRRAFLEAEFPRGLDRHRGDESLAVDVELDVGDRGPLEMLLMVPVS